MTENEEAGGSDESCQVHANRMRSPGRNIVLTGEHMRSKMAKSNELMEARLDELDVEHAPQGEDMGGFT